MSKGRVLTIAMSTLSLGALIFWIMSPSDVQDRSPAQDHDKDPKPSSAIVDTSHENNATPESISNLDVTVPFPDLSELSQEALIGEALSPKERTLSQRSLTLRTIQYESEALESDVIREIAKQQIRAPLPPSVLHDPDGVYDYFFRATGLYLEQGGGLSQSNHELVEMILAQPSMVGRKAILNRLQLMAPEQFPTLVHALSKKGLYVPPTLDGTPSENLPMLDAASTE